jgi:hypothetical protein
MENSKVVLATIQDQADVAKKGCNYSANEVAKIAELLSLLIKVDERMKKYGVRFTR